VPEYRFPRWRQAVFVAVMIAVLVVTIGPPVSQGTLNVRVTGIIPPGIISHVYVRFSSVQIHISGFASSSGLITLTQLLPRIDLVQVQNPSALDTLISARISSGRYDSIILQPANATVIASTGQSTPVSLNSALSAAAMIQVPPNSSGDVLVILNADYVQLISSTPFISLSLVQAVGA
jgi:uncharacterized protein DUF4382